MEEKELIEKLLEKAKTNKKAFALLKNAAVTCQDFEVAAQLREIENNLFPETEELKEAKAYGREVSVMLRLLELNVDETTAWLIGKAMELYKERGGKASLEDAAKLLAQKHQLFDK